MMAMITSQDTPKSEPLPMKAKGRSELNTVVSLPSRRAMPRTAVNDPSVTMKGGNPIPAINAPLATPNTAPVIRPAKTASMPNEGSFDTISATMAATARMEPTERSIPPVRMTKVMPAASTVLIAACWATTDRFCPDMKRPLLKASDMLPVSV